MHDFTIEVLANYNLFVQRKVLHKRLSGSSRQKNSDTYL